MIHEIVEAVHREEKINSARISSHTAIWKEKGVAEKMLQAAEVTLHLTPRELVGVGGRKLTVRFPNRRGFIDRVKARLEKKRWKIQNVAENSLDAIKGERKYTLELTSAENKVKITPHAGGPLPALERFALERKLKQFVTD